MHDLSSEYNCIIKKPGATPEQKQLLETITTSQLFWSGLPIKKTIIKIREVTLRAGTTKLMFELYILILARYIYYFVAIYITEIYAILLYKYTLILNASFLDLSIV